MKKSIINTAVAAALSAAVMAPAQADIQNFSFNGFFTILDGNGVALSNTSITAKGANTFQTPIVGTMAFDTVTGAGTSEIDPFQFFGGDTSLPATATGINMQSIGDGAGGPGTLVLGNMLFNWNGNDGIPVSIVLDAQGFFAGDLDGTGGLGAVPASDGIFVGATVPGTVTGPGGYAGYLGLGPVPIATTAWNTTDDCTVLVDCIGDTVSGILPLIRDEAGSVDYTENIGGGAVAGNYGSGGSPMLDGPFTGSYANFDITDMTFVSQVAGTIPANCDFNPADPTCFGTIVPEIPVPAAVWLFGSGLLGLVGVARRRKSTS